MIYRDKNEYIVTHDGDGGDSANRAGLHTLFAPRPMYHGLTRYEVWEPGYGQKTPANMEAVRCGKPSGLLTRHPLQTPWNNPKNFTRDQLIPFVAGCHRAREYALVRRVFWRHARRLFFCQNSERDYPGTKKSLFPQYYKAGARFDDKTIIQKDGWVWKPNFADILAPHDIWHLILCGRIWYLYWLAPLGFASLLISLWFHCRYNKGNDEGQIISLCEIAGEWFKRKYKQWRTGWQTKLETYWNGWRKEQSLCSMIIYGMEK
jgi:hypothetical protein